MRYLPIAYILLLITCPRLYGQYSENRENEPGGLSLKIKSINFVKNNEYFNPITEGYTLIGFFVRPELIYSPSAKINLRAGSHLLSYSGTGKFTEARPVFSATMNISKGASLTIGSLPGSDKHLLFDPHFNSERLYNSYAEDGFQLNFENEHLFSDTWLSWENYIFKGDNTREVFTFGESFIYKSTLPGDILKFEIPIQIQFKHFGGQISNYPEHVETYFNFAAGLKICFDLEQKRYGQAGIEFIQFINKEFNGESQSGISEGYASWIKLDYRYKSLHAGAAYWKSHNFFAPNGNAIYGSVSDFNINTVISSRKLITNFINLTLLPEKYFEIFLGLETYYDISRNRMDNSVTLHMNFDKLFRLATIK